MSIESIFISTRITRISNPPASSFRISQSSPHPVPESRIIQFPSLMFLWLMTCSPFLQERTQNFPSSILTSCHSHSHCDCRCLEIFSFLPYFLFGSPVLHALWRRIRILFGASLSLSLSNPTSSEIKGYFFFFLKLYKLEKTGRITINTNNEKYLILFLMPE